MRRSQLLLTGIIPAGIIASTACSAQEQKDESFEKYGQEFKGKVAKSYEESQEWWPSSPKPPAGTPNVMIILLDDTGFGHLNCFGGLSETPNIDKLAENGLRYNNFHTIISTRRRSVHHREPRSWPAATTIASGSARIR